MLALLSKSFFNRITCYSVQNVINCNVRKFATSDSEQMIEILKRKFPTAKNIEVVDVSGGCGAMYEVLVESSEFKGLSVVKQHRMINETLKDQIKQMHGLRIHTIIPKDDGS